MTPEAQRIAIHKALGWIEVIEGPSHYAWKRGDEFHYVAFTPNYLNDLNAMHEAEKVLMEKPNAGELVTLYITHLEDSHPRWITPCFATAAQRAEAFLRTLNLWTH